LANSSLLERSDIANDISFLDIRDLDKRARAPGDALPFCLPGQPKSVVVPQTYSGYKTVAGLANKGWIHVGKPLACGIIGLVIDKVQPASVSFVTEHVFEKKTLRNAIMFMAEGKVPGGGTLSKGAAVVQGIFSPGGVSSLGPK
jgi:hypothetical protein